MHVGDTVLAQLGELLRQRLPPEPSAHGSPAIASSCWCRRRCRRRAFRESLREGAERLAMTHAAAQLPVSISIGVARLDCAATSWRTCWRGRDRLQGRQGPRPQPRRGVRAERPEHRAPLRRHRHRGKAARGDRRRTSASLRAAHPALAAADTARPHYELLLRMTDEDGRTVGPDTFLSAANRYQLMRHRSLGHQPRHRVAQARAAVLEGQALGFASISPASPSATITSRTS